ncbi:aspartate dehydrogenase domain-containing protein [Leucobacter sp. 1207-22]|uniref:aspartate dehydrogenase domain-containing protein n=1 Tax=Leucobacter sp. 1207-22 TaxID=2604456 RepID=UPI0040634059
MTLRVAVLGHGAIGARVAAELAAGNITGAELVGVIVRRPGSGGGHPEISLEAALEAGCLIAECAGIPAVTEYGERIISAGGRLLLVSIGALADAELRTVLFAGPGELYLSTGAIGGLDLLAAASRDGGITAANITSTKKAGTLAQPWMSNIERTRLATATEAFTLFEGSVAEAVQLFPASLNVACALASATGLWDSASVQLIADPQAKLTRHRIAASGPAGTYSFDIVNEPSPVTPTSSGVVAEAILSGIRRLAGQNGVFV